ncbi:MAG: helix-turn-helix domain-containing protein, partial [bacterium]
DIPLLADHFIKKHAERNGRKEVSITPEAMEVLCHYNWRGNVREIENVMERALLLCGAKEIEPQHLLMGQAVRAANVLPDAIASAKNARDAAAGQAAAGDTTGAADQAGQAAAGKREGGLGIGVGMSMREAEKKLIFETLRKLKGNRTQAAKMLSISIRTLRNKLNEYSAEGEKFDSDEEGSG